MAFFSGISSAVSDFFGYLGQSFSLSNIISTLKGALGDAVKLFRNVITTFTKLKTLFSDVQHLFDTAKGEIDGWKNFKQDIRLKSRVINLESALKKTRDLIQGIPDSWHSLLDIIKQIKSAIQKDAVAEEGAALLAVETAGLSEVATAVAIIYQVLSFVESITSDLQTILDELMRLRLEIEKLDTIFLSQSNKRKIFKLADGSSIRVRLGKLHVS